MEEIKSKVKSSTEEFNRTMTESDQGKYFLSLYITGNTYRSTLALINLKKICDEHLEGRYVLEVIDLYQNPSIAKAEQIIVAPTRIKKLPHPCRRLIGDMSNIEKVLMGLDLIKVTVNQEFHQS